MNSSFIKSAGRLAAAASVLLFAGATGASPAFDVPRHPDQVSEGQANADKTVGVSTAGGAALLWNPATNYSLSPSADQRFIYITIDAGFTAANCPAVAVPAWNFTMNRDGVAIVNTPGYTFWQNIFPISGGFVCGFQYTYSEPAYEVLAPGNYNANLVQPAYGAPLPLTLPLAACAAAGTTTMYLTRHNTLTDNFYTTLFSDRQDSINISGYVAQPNPFRVPRRSAVTATWMRYFKGAPQLEHFYTHLAAEHSTVTSLGWAYERDEGNVYTSTTLSGTLPLIRLSKFDGATGDLQHVYVTSTAAESSYQSLGWVSDGQKGNVCPP